MLVLLFAVYSTRRFVLSVVLCYFVIVLFSPFSFAITPLGEERANLSVFRMFVRFALVWFCLFSLPLGVREGLRFVIVALPGLFSYLFSYVAFALSLLVPDLSFFWCPGVLCFLTVAFSGYIYIYIYILDRYQPDSNHVVPITVQYRFK